MNKILFSIFLVFSIISFLYADWAEYKPITLEEISKIIIETTSDEHAKFGLTYYNIKSKLKIKFNNYPVIIDKSTLEARNVFPIYNSNNINMANIYNHQIKYIHENKNYIFLFQDALVPYFIKEVKLRSEVELFVLIGFYHDLTKNLYLYVNEFSTK